MIGPLEVDVPVADVDVDMVADVDALVEPSLVDLELVVSGSVPPEPPEPLESPHAPRTLAAATAPPTMTRIQAFCMTLPQAPNSVAKDSGRSEIFADRAAISPGARRLER